MFDEPKWASFHGQIQKFILSVKVSFNRVAGNCPYILVSCYIFIFSIFAFPFLSMIYISGQYRNQGFLGTRDRPWESLGRQKRVQTRSQTPLALIGIGPDIFKGQHLPTLIRTHRIPFKRDTTFYCICELKNPARLKSFISQQSCVGLLPLTSLLERKEFLFQFFVLHRSKLEIFS